jgi:hypothetical protein
LDRLPLLLLLMLLLLLLLLLQLLLLLLRLLLLVLMQLLAFLPMLADTQNNCCCAGAPRHWAWGADRRSRIVASLRINTLLIDILVLVLLLPPAWPEAAGTLNTAFQEEASSEDSLVPDSASEPIGEG